MVNNHVFPNASTTALDGVFASFAAADVRYTSKCQNASDFERLPTGSAAIIQHPSSLFRSATGLHTCASASSQVANSAPIQIAHEQKRDIVTSRELDRTNSASTSHDSDAVAIHDGAIHDKGSVDAFRRALQQLG